MKDSGTPVGERSEVVKSISMKLNLFLPRLYDIVNLHEYESDGSDGSDGYKLLDNNIKFQFVNVLNQKSIIKLYLVLENNNTFFEFSENYYFDLKNIKSYVRCYGITSNATIHCIYFPILIPTGKTT